MTLPGNDALYRLLVENVVDYAIILLGTDGRIATWTEGAGRMFGFAEEEAVGRSLGLIYPPEDEGAAACDLHAVLRDGRCETVAWRVRRDGSRLWASVVLTAIHDRRGRAVGVGQITRDLTERKEVAERYEESRQRYRSLFENHPDAVCSLDLDGEVRASNAAAEALTGYAGDDLQGMPFRALVAPAERARVEAALAAAAGGAPRQVEAALVHRAGRRVEVRLTLVPIEVSGIAGVYAIAQDIGERLRAQAERESLLLRERIARAEAEAANQAKSDFLAVVSHELRTPLNAILNYADLLLDGDLGDVAEPARRHLDRVRANAAHLSGLIDDVLGYTRLDTGGPVARLEPVEVGALARELLAEQRAPAEAKGLALEAEDGAGPVWAMTDPARLRPLLRALLSNAVKFTDAGTVRLAWGAEDGGVAIRVEDSGIGIDPAHADRIWEPFWQAEEPRIRRAGGTGLGLSIARRLAALLAGEVEARSAPGAGSVFTVRLPAVIGELPTTEAPGP